jgi:alpha-ketoglutarate-dependent taurine dioxygenase
VDRFGGVIIHLADHLLSSRELLDFASKLGQPMPETAPAVQKYVEYDSVLNLRREYGLEENAEVQPFATNAITLHTEGSRNPVERQPRLLVFQCRETAAAGQGGQTVLVRMDDVFQCLSDSSARILRQTKYVSPPGCPFIIREVNGRPTFSFRDFKVEPLEWTYAGLASDDAESVNHAISEALVGMYGAPWTGVHWHTKVLVILSNFHFFHGRTAIVSQTERHLQRVRLL